MDRVRAAEREMGMPVSMNGYFQGSAQAFQDSLQGMGVLLLVAILVIYIVLGILVRELHSSDHDFVGPALGRHGRACSRCILFKIDLSLYAFVGVIMLIGIVKKERDHDDRLRD